MKQIIIISFFLIQFTALSQDWLEDKENLNGNVKTLNYNSISYKQYGEDWIENFEYQYNTKGFLTKNDLKSYIFDGSAHSGLVRVYDDEGTHCLTESIILDDGSTSRFNFEYDTLQRVKKAIYYSGNEHWSTFNYLYNSKGLLTERFVVLQRSNDTIWNIYKYDEFGNKIRDSHISSTWDKYLTWQYDQHGNLLQKKSFEEKSPTTTVYTIYEDGSRDKKTVDRDPHDEDNYIVNYTYNDKNQVVREVKRYLDDSLYHDIQYTYNEKDDVLTETFVNEDSTIKWILYYEYKYDVNGNWVSKIIKWNNEIERKEEREIEYY